MTASVFAADETATVQNGEVGAKIVEWVKEAGECGFSGVVFAARDGKVVAAVGVGSADLEGAVPNTPATLFEIASATKQFTAAAVLRLVDRRKIKLDDPISKYLPGIPEDCAGITVRHLLQHTSGIPGANSAGGGTDLALVLPAFLKGGPKFEPGTHWEYWNQGYALLSEIIARASGQSYVEFLKKDVFAPAKMTSTCFTGDQPPRGATVAIGRSARGPSRSALDHPYGEYGFQYRGMGGVVTNVWDLWRWHQALEKRLLKTASKKELFKPGLNDYALGWFVKTEDGRVVQSHGGGVRGFICEIRRYPEHDACIFVLANRDDAPLRQVVAGVEQLLFEEPLTVVLPRPADPELAKTLEGIYADPRGNRLTVSQQGETILAIINWKAGMVSRMVVSRGADGELMMIQGAQSYPLEVGEVKDGKATSLTFTEVTFTR